jgi:RecA/RadA recombinase
MSADTSSSKAHGSSSSRPAAQPLGQSLKNSAESLRDDVGEAIDRGQFNVADSARAAGDNLAEDLARLRADMSKIQETLSAFVSEIGGETARTMGSVGHSVAKEFGSAASSIADASAEIAGSAKDQVKTFASELEATARKNPLGTLAAALLAGIVIGMMTRGRN